MPLDPEQMAALGLIPDLPPGYGDTTGSSGVVMTPTQTIPPMPTRAPPPGKSWWFDENAINSSGSFGAWVPVDDGISSSGGKSPPISVTYPGSVPSAISLVYNDAGLGFKYNELTNQFEPALLPDGSQLTKYGSTGGGNTPTNPKIYEASGTPTGYVYGPTGQVVNWDGSPYNGPGYENGNKVETTTGSNSTFQFNGSLWRMGPDGKPILVMQGAPTATASAFRSAGGDGGSTGGVSNAMLAQINNAARAAEAEADRALKREELAQAKILQEKAQALQLLGLRLNFEGDRARDQLEYMKIQQAAAKDYAELVGSPDPGAFARFIEANGNLMAGLNAGPQGALSTQSLIPGAQALKTIQTPFSGPTWEGATGGMGATWNPVDGSVSGGSPASGGAPTANAWGNVGGATGPRAGIAPVSAGQNELLMSGPQGYGYYTKIGQTGMNPEGTLNYVGAYTPNMEQLEAPTGSPQSGDYLGGGATNYGFGPTGTAAAMQEGLLNQARNIQYDPQHPELGVTQAPPGILIDNGNAGGPIDVTKQATIPMLGSGGPTTAPMMLVGERGPELVRNPWMMPLDVIPNHQTEQMMRQGMNVPGYADGTRDALVEAPVVTETRTPVRYTPMGQPLYDALPEPAPKVAPQPVAQQPAPPPTNPWLENSPSVPATTNTAPVTQTPPYAPPASAGGGTTALYVPPATTAPPAYLGPPINTNTATTATPLLDQVTLQNILQTPGVDPAALGLTPAQLQQVLDARLKARVGFDPRDVYRFNWGRQDPVTQAVKARAFQLGWNIPEEYTRWLPGQITPSGTTRQRMTVAV